MFVFLVQFIYLSQHLHSSSRSVCNTRQNLNSVYHLSIAGNFHGIIPNFYITCQENKYRKSKKTTFL